MNGKHEERNKKETEPTGRETRKRKADVLSRLEQSSVSQHGRGALVGWTSCPLCGTFSRKRYALGRGIASHLHAVHSPWNPGRAERKKRKRLLERANRERRNGNDNSNDNDNDAVTKEIVLTWEPTEQERQEWNEQVLKITTELEANAETENNEKLTETKKDAGFGFVGKGLDRSGKTAVDYKQSLPPFIQAAANGDLETIQSMIKENQDCIVELLNTRDRNGSTAAHWAAGNGHLKCLQYLCRLHAQHRVQPQKRVRRREGKMCLHYAARNGHVDCIRYLIENGHETVDATSGDGTTPLHMACFGGHVPAIKLLLQSFEAKLDTVNDWGCGVSHWIAMTKCQSRKDVWDICTMLKSCGVDFCTIQNQGHSPLHKAAQRCNRSVIEWLDGTFEEGGAGMSRQQKQQIGQPDNGGHKPSDILHCVGGDESFGEWMKERGW